MAVTGFARPFRVVYPDRPELALHGAQFPDGRCVLVLPHGGFAGTNAFEHLELLPGAVVEWADGLGQDGGEPS